MTGQQLKEAYQRKWLLRQYLENNILDAGDDWIQGQLAEIDQEIHRAGIEEMKKPAGQGGLH